MRDAGESRPFCAVTIAGSDSGGGAGVQADLATFAAHGVYGGTVLVAGTAQNTRGVLAVELLSVRFVGEQIDAVFSDLEPSAVKLGMLGDGRRVRAVAAGLRRHRPSNVVADPVIRSTSGAVLLSPDGARAFQREILPLCRLVTPNLEEAATLAGIDVRSDLDRREAARRIAALGARAVLVKGGHGGGERIRDFLWERGRFRAFDHGRIATRAVHGTGCVLSAAIAANLALGYPLGEAVARAIRYLRRALRRGVFPGGGAGVPGHRLTSRVLTPRTARETERALPRGSRPRRAP